MDASPSDPHALQQQVRDLEARLEAERARAAELERQLAEQRDAHGAFPPGHYYSTIPDADELAAHLATYEPADAVLPDIDLRAGAQRALVDDFARFYAELPFPEQPRDDCRYHYEQEWFTYGDAIFLYAFLRQHRPRTIVEVGSGFSSAVMLETAERFLPDETSLTFLDPNPERLLGVLREGDRARTRVITERIQDVPLETFACLGPGDLLFIDSSHVMKCGSDLQLILFELLPHLPEGVFVHFHDVFYPFEYPAEWLRQGRFWNEDYVLRAFLAYNRDWAITFFNTYACYAFRDVLAERMPLCLRNPGGGLYLQRVARG